MSFLNITPIDGRYNSKTRRLSGYFSEFGFMKYRLEVELKYFIFLNKLLENREVISRENEILEILNNFSVEHCQRIKDIEVTCNHDVKSVEYFIREKFVELNLGKFNQFIHFGLTSQDINNTAITKSIRDYLECEYIPTLKKIIEDINEKANFYKEIVMLSRTHGQPAVPSTLGKELRVFSYRIEKQLQILNNIQFYGKFGGAVGNLNAHYLAYPDISWEGHLEAFLKNDLGLIREKYTTQIDNYENLAVVFDCIRRINTILIDFDRDIWQYISMEYLSQTFDDNEVGSSTMPQKINPINFENSEGNLMVANALLDFMSNKLPVSRLQRDLTDSTVLRNVGSVFGYTEIAYQNFLIGFSKVKPNILVINRDLNNNISILTEGIQIILRREGIEDSYEKVKEMCRGKPHITYDDFYNFIDNLEDLSLNAKRILKEITPETYIGNAKIVD
jgi:adenylosuccinate lyase